MVNVSELLGEAIISKDNRRHIDLYKSKWSKIPLLTWEQACAYPNIDLHSITDYSFIDIQVSKKAFAIKMLGSSMEPLFPEAQFLTFEPENKPKDRDYVLAVVAAANMVFKQLLIDGKDYYLKSLNQDLREAENNKYRQF